MSESLSKAFSMNNKDYLDQGKITVNYESKSIHAFYIVTLRALIILMSETVIDCHDALDHFFNCR